MHKRIACLALILCGIAVSAPAQNSVKLNWQLPTSQPAGVTVASLKVYKAFTGGGPYTIAATLPATATTWTDAGLASGTRYYVVAIMSNGGQLSVYSNEATAVIPGTPPPPPPPPPPSTYILTAIPTALSFSGVSGGASIACKSLVIDDTTPSGPLPLLISAPTWLTVVPLSGSTKLSMNACPSSSGTAGMVSGSVVVMATGPNGAGETVNNSPLSVPVSLTLTAPPPPPPPPPTPVSKKFSIGDTLRVVTTGGRLNIRTCPAGAVVSTIVNNGTDRITGPAQVANGITYWPIARGCLSDLFVRQ